MQTTELSDVYFVYETNQCFVYRICDIFDAVVFVVDCGGQPTRAWNTRHRDSCGIYVFRITCVTLSSIL